MAHFHRLYGIKGRKGGGHAVAVIGARRQGSWGKVRPERKAFLAPSTGTSAIRRWWFTLIGDATGQNKPKKYRFSPASMLKLAMLAEINQRSTTMAPKAPKTLGNTPATPAMSLEDMRAAVAAADLAAKAAEAAAKLAAKKSVGRPGRKGTEQRTYHQSAEAIAALAALKSATGNDLSVIVDESIMDKLNANAKALAIFSAMTA